MRVEACGVDSGLTASQSPSLLGVLAKFTIELSIYFISQFSGLLEIL